MLIRNLINWVIIVRKVLKKSYLKNFALRKHMLVHFLLCSYDMEYEGLEYSNGNIYDFMEKICIVLQIYFVNSENFEDFLGNVFCQMVIKNTQ